MLPVLRAPASPFCPFHPTSPWGIIHTHGMHPPPLPEAELQTPPLLETSSCKSKGTYTQRTHVEPVNSPPTAASCPAAPPAPPHSAPPLTPARNSSHHIAPFPPRIQPMPPRPSRNYGTSLKPSLRAIIPSYPTPQPPFPPHYTILIMIVL